MSNIWKQYWLESKLTQEAAWFMALDRLCNYCSVSMFWNCQSRSSVVGLIYALNFVTMWRIANLLACQNGLVVLKSSFSCRFLNSSFLTPNNVAKIVLIGALNASRVWKGSDFWLTISHEWYKIRTCLPWKPIGSRIWSIALCIMRWLWVQCWLVSWKLKVSEWQWYVVCVYMCVCVVRLQHPPIITDGPRNQTVLVGDTVRFACDLLSDPEYHLQWLKQLDEDDVVGNETKKFVVLHVSVVMYNIVSCGITVSEWPVHWWYLLLLLLFFSTAQALGQKLS